MCAFAESGVDHAAGDEGAQQRSGFAG